MTLLHRTLAATLVLAVPAAAIDPAPAVADSKSDKAKKKKQAKAYVDAGLAAYESGDYDSAVDFYQKAYEVLPHPVLLFNIAQAHRLGGRTAEALESYRRYLAADAKGPHASEAKGFVKELEPIVARQAEELRKAEQLAAEEKARREEEAKPPPDPEPGPDPGPEPVKLPPPEEEEEPSSSGGDGMSGMRIAGIATGGVGLVGIGAGVFFGMKAGKLSDELSETGAYYDVDKIAEGEAAERNMFIAYGVGGVLVATGVVLFVLGGGGEEASEEEVSLTPVFTGDRAGLVFGGRF